MYLWKTISHGQIFKDWSETGLIWENLSQYWLCTKNIPAALR